MRDGALGDREVHLAVQYEYTPTLDAVEGYALGGRAEAWLSHHVAVGVTGIAETTGLADQRLIGADLTLRMTETTFLEAELAQSRGVGFGQWVSTDGGLTFVNQPDTGSNIQSAMAYHLKGQIDLADVSGGQIAGQVGAFYDTKQAGFATTDQQTTIDQVVWGTFAKLDLTEAPRCRHAMRG
ncbi:hypothetical protein ABIB57_003558 [Devosia sp. UYZn731]|uniref:hypothetical protein n=1 Tax=Devosia sp. UYZn731 TaxID=3156345 RepID=UPI0033971C69